MSNVLFVVSLAAGFAVLLVWACKVLPRDGWQMIASVPIRRHHGHWEGVNLTFYGLLTASAAVFASGVFILLMASIHVALIAALLAVGAVLLCCAPAASLIARVVEGKRHTLTVAGALFVGLLIGPPVILTLNAVGSDTMQSPLAPTLAAMAIAYAIGEGLGRLACISFGCCYGKPIDQLPRSARRWFERFHFAFRGETRKISYAGGLEGIKVVPVQALTAAFFVSVGLGAMLLFLDGWFRSAFLGAILLTQLWRFYSETLRADYRGGGDVTAYQLMSALGMLYSIALAIELPDAAVQVSLLTGLEAMWNPIIIVALQAMWAALFVYTGWSMVTGSIVSFHVHHDRV
ncbi:MAG TPA: prolipoprotein diacylglyceryl transferase family protein [Candidatus Acidoferrales bacterium]|nr:prolipoprotein diacylglyceryl transferase family protein [Candidatus Acidoferrales bacterium]